MLKQEYKEGEMNLNDALLLAIKTLSKTLDMTKITADKGIINNLFDLAINVCLRVFNLNKVVAFLNACTCTYFGNKCTHFELHVQV